MSKYFLFVLTLILAHSSLSAQKTPDTYIISGTIVERASQSPLCLLYTSDAADE